MSKVWKGAGASLKEASLLGPRGAEGKIKGGVVVVTYLGWLRAGECQASWFTNGWRDSGSAPEGGEWRAVPARWAGASGSRSCRWEPRGGRAGLRASAAPSAAAPAGAPVRAPSRPPAAAAELPGGREVPERSTDSGLSAPACEPARLPNATVK